MMVIFFFQKNHMKKPFFDWKFFDHQLKSNFDEWIYFDDEAECEDELKF